MSPPTNNWNLRRTEHRFYAEIILGITTWKSECKDIRIVQSTTAMY